MVYYGRYQHEKVILYLNGSGSHGVYGGGSGVGGGVWHAYDGHAKLDHGTG